MLYVSSKYNKSTLWRNNTAQGWAGKIIGKGPSYVTLSDPYPLRAWLFVGSSDLIGITEVIITPEMVGQKIGRFTAFEVKTDSGKTSKEQKVFIDFVKSKGGIAGVVRSEEDIDNLLR